MQLECMIRNLQSTNNKKKPSYITPGLITYPKEVPSYHKDACSTMLIVVLLIKTVNRKQPRYPSSKE